MRSYFHRLDVFRSIGRWCGRSVVGIVVRRFGLCLLRCLAGCVALGLETHYLLGARTPLTRAEYLLEVFGIHHFLGEKGLGQTGVSVLMLADDALGAFILLVDDA